MQTGFILIFDEEKRARKISDYIDSAIPFTEALSSADHNPKKREVFILSLDGQNFDAICLGERKNRVVTFKYRVSFSHFIPIRPALPIKVIEQKFNKTLKQHFIRASNGDGARVPQKTWEALITLIKKERKEISKRLEVLFSLQDIKQYSGKNHHIEAFNRDATTLSLRMAGIDPKRADFVCVDRNGDTVGELPAFLMGLENNQLREDRMIIRDTQIFSDWLKLKVTPDITARFTDGSKTLIIQNFNREPAETELGIDLMYFNEYYKSFVLIQYKAFSPDSEGKAYRLSASGYKAEYERMSALQKYLDSIQKINHQISNYRFHNGACYFKFCDRGTFELNSTEMIKGMYIPLDYWDKLIVDDITLGKKGGRIISYQNVERYFNNSQFIDLVKEGWIGTTIAQSDELGKIISEILKTGKSIILANFRDSNRR